MSSYIHIHPCCSEDLSVQIRSDDLLTLSKFVDWKSDQETLAIMGKDVPCEPITLPINCTWIGSGYETRSPKDIDPICTKLVRARSLKGIHFYEDSWNKNLIAYAKAIQAFLESLPDNWPVVLYII